MAETLEREYTIPLRRHWMNAARYERTRKAVKAIKEFVAQHMKITDRNLDNVKLDVDFNNEVWYRGTKSPPTKVKVKVRKEGEIAHVTFAEIPEHIKFKKARHERVHVKSEKKTEKAEEKKEEKKIDEAEKEKSVAIANEKANEMKAKAEKHTTKVKETGFHRMALQK